MQGTPSDMSAFTQVMQWLQTWKAKQKEEIEARVKARYIASANIDQRRAEIKEEFQYLVDRLATEDAARNRMPEPEVEPMQKVPVLESRPRKPNLVLPKTQQPVLLQIQQQVLPQLQSITPVQNTGERREPQNPYASNPIQQPVLPPLRQPQQLLQLLPHNLRPPDGPNLHQKPLQQQHLSQLCQLQPHYIRPPETSQQPVLHPEQQQLLQWLHLKLHLIQQPDLHPIQQQQKLIQLLPHHVRSPDSQQKQQFVKPQDQHQARSHPWPPDGQHSQHCQQPQVQQPRHHCHHIWPPDGHTPNAEIPSIKQNKEDWGKGQLTSLNTPTHVVTAQCQGQVKCKIKQNGHHPECHTKTTLSHEKLANYDHCQGCVFFEFQQEYFHLTNFNMQISFHTPYSPHSFCNLHVSFHSCSIQYTQPVKSYPQRACRGCR